LVITSIIRYNWEKGREELPGIRYDKSAICREVSA